jgi:predicted metal-dependent enzyme (double-stranded beta helix superfamily)
LSRFGTSRLPLTPCGRRTSSRHCLRCYRPFLSDDANRRLPSLRQFSDRYLRLLLTSFNDDFQIVVALWGPGSASPIHDHDGTVGAVSALVGETEETKYEVLSPTGGLAELRRGTRLALRPATTTPIFPNDATQLHEMKNTSRREWSATIHVYMDAIQQYGVYKQQPNGYYLRELRDLWFDADDAWTLWATPPEQQIAAPTT